MPKAAWHHLYNRAAWKRLRLNQLAHSPLCVMCADSGKVTAATVVDHARPHKGDEELFFDPTNLQSLCKHHHDASKQRAEAQGFMPGCDESGNPIDPHAAWV